MDNLRIIGGNQLEGTIRISGAKNAVLPLMIASLLSKEKLILKNVPTLQDVNTLQNILEHHGVICTNEQLEKTLSISASHITNLVAHYMLVSQMRASFWVIGPLLARCGSASVSLPGGCSIGIRPVDFIIAGLEKLGAEISMASGYVIATVKNRLRGNRIKLPKTSVGATHTIMMAATLAKGETVIENAAREPEIVDVANCLKSMGACIEGAGTNKIYIQGVDSLHGTTHYVMPDRIEAGTYAMAVAMTGGNVLLEGIHKELLSVPITILEESGLEVDYTENGIRVRCNACTLSPCNITTAPFPDFPTDLQAQLTSMMTQASGISSITESIFENRFTHVGELCRLGAKISTSGQRCVLIKGKTKLTGAPVMATDLRASVSLVLAGLVAQGTTTISRVYHLDRGFENLEDKLSQCGAMIERFSCSRVY